MRAQFYVSSKITADGKAETLKWMASLAAAGKISDCIQDALRAAAIGSGDKAAEVRDAATKLVTSLVEVRTCMAYRLSLKLCTKLSQISCYYNSPTQTVGAAELGAAAQSLDAASRKSALEAISKVTGAPVPAVGATAFGASGASSAKPALPSVSALCASCAASAEACPAH